MICELILLLFCAIKSYTEIHTAKTNLFLEEPVVVMNKIHEYMNNKNSSGDEIANVFVNDDIAHT